MAAFEQKTGIQVNVRTNDGVVLANQILEEGANSPADVYLTGNSPELMLLQQKGFLVHLDANTLAQIPSVYDSPQGDWVGVALRVSCLAYDPHLINKDDLPTSLLDLSQPKWKGKIAIAPSDSDFLPLVGGVINEDGKDAAFAWLQGLQRNAQIYQDDESVVAAVNRGAVAMGIINQYYWYRQRCGWGKSTMCCSCSSSQPPTGGDTSSTG